MRPGSPVEDEGALRAFRPVRGPEEWDFGRGSEHEGERRVEEGTRSRSAVRRRGELRQHGLARPERQR